MDLSGNNNAVYNTGVFTYDNRGDVCNAQLGHSMRQGMPERSLDVFFSPRSNFRVYTNPHKRGHEIRMDHKGGQMLTVVKSQLFSSQALAGTAYYRIKQIDRDGRST